MTARILFASLSKPSSRDANAIQIDRMCAAMVQGGNRVTLTAVGAKPIESKSYGQVVLPWPFVRLRTRLMQAVTTIALWRLRPDILFTRSPLLALPGLAYGAQVVLELHGLPREGSKTFSALRKVLHHRNLRRIVTISQTLADDLISECGPPHSGCDVVIAHDGAEAGPRPGPAKAHGGPLKVGYFGHLYPGKGMETIAELAPLVPEMDFEVYGGAEADILRWRKACSRINNITLHGYIAHASVPARMADCDVLIAPYSMQVSHSGSGDIGRWMSPLKLFEYMSAERPIVVADLPVLREVVRDGETALLCSPGNSVEFANALRCLAGESSMRLRLGSAARYLLETKYTWEKRAVKILAGIAKHSIS